MKDVETGGGRVGVHQKRTKGEYTGEQLDIVQRHGKLVYISVWSYEGNGICDKQYGLRCIHK